MKPLTTTLLLLASVATVSGLATYASLRPEPVSEDCCADSLFWLKREFGLGGERLERIQKLHTAYHSICEEHCAAILRARTTVRELERDGAPADALAAARAEVSRLDLQCRTSLEGHIREVASLMDEDSGRRYLEIVLPRLGTFDHEGAPDLGMNPSRVPHGAHHGR